ncbi:MAG: hypothetical protein GWP09_03185 [Nitrospiraceae bacterium]|nr:hypothetical protein [Nitrospiraceae bacterium]
MPITLPFGISQEQTTLIILISVFAVVFGVLYVLLKGLPFFKEENERGARVTVTIGLTLLIIFATPIIDWINPLMRGTVFTTVWGVAILFIFMTILLLISMGHRSYANLREQGAQSYKMRADAYKVRNSAKRELEDINGEKRIAKDIKYDIRQLMVSDEDEEKKIERIKSILMGIAHGKFTETERMNLGAELTKLMDFVTEYERKQYQNLYDKLKHAEVVLDKISKMEKTGISNIKTEINRLQSSNNPDNKRRLNEVYSLRKQVGLLIGDKNKLKKDYDHLLNIYTKGTIYSKKLSEELVDVIRTGSSQSAKNGVGFCDDLLHLKREILSLEERSLIIDKKIVNLSENLKDDDKKLIKN